MVTSDDREDPDANAFWTGGTFHIDASAQAAPPSGATITAVSRHPLATATPIFKAKTALGLTAPTPVGNCVTPATGTGNDFAEAGVTIPGTGLGAMATAYSNGTAYLDTTLIDEYEMNVEACADVLVFSGATAASAASISDPTVFGWLDDEPHVLVMQWTLGKDTVLNALPDGHAAAAGLDFESSLDLDNDGSFDQLFWSVSIGTDGSLPSADIKIGSGAILGGSKTETEIEDEIRAFFSSPDAINVASDYVIEFQFRIAGGSPGHISYSYDVSGNASAASVPYKDDRRRIDE